MIVRRWSHGGAWGEVSEFRESYGYYIYVSRVCRSLRDRLQTRQGPGGAGAPAGPETPPFPGTPARDRASVTPIAYLHPHYSVKAKLTVSAKHTPAGPGKRAFEVGCRWVRVSLRNYSRCPQVLRQACMVEEPTGP